MNRRTWLQSVAALGLLAMPVRAESGKRIPVIFHTDIGGDVDDTWALLLLLRQPELDLKLVVTEGGNARYRGRLAAKLLTLGGSRVPLAIGPDGRDDPAAQTNWIGDFQLADYKGEVRTDGAQAMIDVIMSSEKPVTLITVGPATTAAEALKREPRIAGKARFVAMAGSVRTGYGAGKPPEVEYNVKADPASWQAVFAADWLDCAITPLDTCGFVVFDGLLYQKIRASRDPFAQAVIANSAAWAPHAFWMPKDFDVTQQSSTQFDAVAVMMVFDESYLVMETLSICVTDEGMTVVDAEKGRLVRVATAWKDMEAFKRRMAASLMQG
jgi:inosine-uridine nucleoside N-ribohydrolase